ncbi:glycosyltransferase [Halomonas qiaohouensis]|uniref:Glycosyltransferase n=2 Tax=Franzmannia qiaohouensis TaxID=1329370 RepID=A0ABU1HJ06_9GAMM|nr:glycosyltransferase [Halomonas qiaohouensis]
MAAYNDPEVLTLTLEGYRRQTDRNFSLCIADDGSGPEVAEVIERYRGLGLNIRHVWHEDRGFRKAQIVNCAIEGSRAEFGLHLPRWASQLWSRKPLALLGANMGVWREHLMAVNGFDSDFEGYGAEEVDLEWRLIGWGVKQRAMRGRGGLIHIHHQRQADAYVFHLLQHKQQAGEVVARNGIR